MLHSLISEISCKSAYGLRYVRFIPLVDPCCSHSVYRSYSVIEVMVERVKTLTIYLKNETNASFRPLVFAKR